MTLVDLEQLRRIALEEFADIVVDARIVTLNEMRIILTNGSFMDTWFSLKLRNRTAYRPGRLTASSSMICA